jgi:alkylation response protein AidB-like acyl-CoA dehydrogenase
MGAWWRILNKEGWGVSHWPKQYGGTGWTSVQHYIFNEELQMHPAPAPLAFGVSMVGPVIYTFGNEAQKKHYLPRIMSTTGGAPIGAVSDAAVVSLPSIPGAGAMSAIRGGPEVADRGSKWRD